MPAVMSMASTGLLGLRICSPVGPPPGSQGPGPSQVDRTTSCNGSRDSHPGSHVLSFGVPCDITPHSRSPSGGSASGFCLPICGGASSSWLALSWRPLDFTPGLVLCPGDQRLGLSGDGFLSLAGWFNAGSPTPSSSSLLCAVKAWDKSWNAPNQTTCPGTSQCTRTCPRASGPTHRAHHSGLGSVSILVQHVWRTLG